MCWPRGALNTTWACRLLTVANARHTHTVLELLHSPRFSTTTQHRERDDQRSAWRSAPCLRVEMVLRLFPIPTSWCSEHVLLLKLMQPFSPFASHHSPEGRLVSAKTHVAVGSLPCISSQRINERQSTWRTLAFVSSRCSTTTVVLYPAQGRFARFVAQIFERSVYHRCSHVRFCSLQCHRRRRRLHFMDALPAVSHVLLMHEDPS